MARKGDLSEREGAIVSQSAENDAVAAGLWDSKRAGGGLGTGRLVECSDEFHPVCSVRSSDRQSLLEPWQRKGMVLMLEIASYILVFVFLSGLMALIDAAVLSVSRVEVEEMVANQQWGSICFAFGKAADFSSRRRDRAVH